MEFHDRDAEPASPEVAPVAAAPAAGALTQLLQQGSPQPAAVAALIARFPADRDAMLELLQARLGNGFVQAVVAAVSPPPDIARGRDRLAELEAGHAFDADAFHGTSSAILPGLEASHGKLLSSARLGSARVTGEGDAFGSRAPDSPQDFVSVGAGAAGFGVAQAYADASQSIKHFDVAAYSDAELAAQIDELDFLVSHYDALQIDLDSFPNGKVEKFQFAQRLDQLRRERARRDALPADHPAHAGAGGDRFPLTFELDVAKVPTTRFNQMPAGMALSGDAGITGEVDLRTQLRRVFCPAAHVAEVRAKLAAIVGRDDFEVIPTESLDVLAATGDVATTRAATLTTLEALEAGFQRFVHAYADAARSGQKIDANYVIARVWQG